MKAIIRLLCFIALIMLPEIVLAQKVFSDQIDVKVISANIRVALKEDVERGYGWEGRKAVVFKILREHQPDILCLQEVLEVQNDDFKEAFPNFFSFGFEGPEMDAHKDDDYHGVAKNPILFSKDKFELVSGGTYWLSETPEIGGSKSWGTARARHVNWVRLKEKSSGKVFRVLNTHFDHVSNEAKMKQAEMIVKESKQYPTDFPQILAGDFNSDITNEPIIKIRKQWIESHSVIHNDVDPGFTTHGFIGDKAKTKKGQVDFIFYRGKIEGVGAEVIRDNVNGVYPSDHYFVSAKLRL